MKICFVVDGGVNLGMGHVQQSIALAQELSDSAAVSFMTKSENAVQERIRDYGFPVEARVSDDELFDALSDEDPDIVIFDKLDVAPDLARRIRHGLRARLAIFTNLTEANRYADLAVTADIGSGFKNISYIDPGTGTRHLFGPRYWVLRPEFRQPAKPAPEFPAGVSRILLIFGGSDPADITSAALDALLSSRHRRTIDVVLGAQFANDLQVERVLDAHRTSKRDVELHRNVRDVASLMRKADLVLASPGLSAFESLCVGTPVIVVPQNDLQRDTYRGVMQLLERHELHRIDDCISQRQFTAPTEPSIHAMEIGQGLDELKELVLGLPNVERT